MGKTIRALREERGWSQHDLAVRVGVTDATVYTWETGRRTPQLQQVRKMGEVFGLPCSDVIDVPERTVFRGKVPRSEIEFPPRQVRE